MDQAEYHLRSFYETKDFVSTIPLSQLLYARFVMLHLLTIADARQRKCYRRNDYSADLPVAWEPPCPPQPRCCGECVAGGARCKSPSRRSLADARLDSAVARGYLIKVAEGLIEAF